MKLETFFLWRRRRKKIFEMWVDVVTWKRMSNRILNENISSGK